MQRDQRLCYCFEVTTATLSLLQDVALHPSEPLVAAALISGRLETHRYDTTASSAVAALSMQASSWI